MPRLTEEDKQKIWVRMKDLCRLQALSGLVYLQRVEPAWKGTVTAYLNARRERIDLEATPYAYTTYLREITPLVNQFIVEHQGRLRMAPGFPSVFNVALTHDFPDALDCLRGLLEREGINYDQGEYAVTVRLDIRLEVTETIPGINREDAVDKMVSLIRAKAQTEISYFDDSRHDVVGVSPLTIHVVGAERV